MSTVGEVVAQQQANRRSPWRRALALLFREWANQLDPPEFVIPWKGASLRDDPGEPSQRVGPA